MEKHLKVLKEAFDYNQTDKVILIDDGTVFLPQAKNLAVDYARKKGLKWKMVTRKAIEQTKPVTGGTDNPDGKKTDATGTGGTDNPDGKKPDATGTGGTKGGATKKETGKK